MRIGIVGGGVYGTAVAFFLRKLGSDEVILFEKEGIGGTSTSKSAGIVRHHYSSESQIRYAMRGREILQDFETLVGSDGGFHQNGYLILASERQETRFRRNVEMQRALGLDVDLLDPAALSDIMPAIDPDGVVVAALERDAGFADPYLVASGFASKARDLGAEIRPNTPITDIAVAHGTVTGVETPNGEYEVDFLVNAGGPAADAVARMAGVDLPLECHEAKIAVLSATEPYGPDLPVLSDIELGLYTKPEPGGEFIVGGMERGNDRRVRDENDLEGVTGENLGRVGEFMERRLPGYADAEVAETWSGLITASPDWHQIIGSTPEVENLFHVAGGSGHGFKEAPGFAESIAQTILGLSSTGDLSPYRPERFDEGDEFAEGYEDGSRA